MNYTYLEIRKRENDEVVKRIDVTDKSERQIDRCEMGMNINLNHEEYYTEQNTNKTPLPVI